MTKEEKNVLNNLADAWNAFDQLPTIHPDDKVHFKQNIHAAQAIVMSREAVRQSPEFFFNSVRKYAAASQFCTCYGWGTFANGICVNCGKPTI